MKTPPTPHRLWLSVILILLFAIPAAADQEEGSMVEIETLAIMPFAVTKQPFNNTAAIKDMVDCKIFGLCSWAKDDDGSKTITASYQHQLRKEMGYKVVPWEQSQAVFQQTPPNPQDTLRNAAKAFGRQARASHVLTGTVWRYRERVGTALSAEQPASVGFTAILVRTRDGLIVWSKPFEKTQSSLSDNLLDAPMFFKKGMRWLSAAELASFGVEQTLRTFPGR
ncbi:hypothetical protein ACFL5J_00605 [Thermodesulfobacteriota bacterium]